MEKHSVDFSQLDTTLTQQTKKSYRLEDVEGRIEKVAFDVVRFRDNSDTDMLWKIQESNEGPVIVALYDEGTGSLSSDGEKTWDAVTEPKTASVHVFYKSEPVARLKASDVGIPFDELHTLAKWLPAKLASDEGVQRAVIQKMSQDNRDLFLARHPELKKMGAVMNMPEQQINALDLPPAPPPVSGSFGPTATPAPRGSTSGAAGGWGRSKRF